MSVNRGPAHRLGRLATRRVMLAAAGGSLLAATGCTGTSTGETSDIGFVETPATPVAVPGRANRWAGRTLRVASFGGSVEQALRTALWEPFGRHTGCTVEGVSTAFTAIASPRGEGTAGTPLVSPPSADLVLADPISTRDSVSRDLLLALPSDLTPREAIGRIAGDRSVPAFAYALVNASHRGAFAADSAPTTWPEWWDSDRYQAKRALGRSPIGTIEVALLGDGVEPADLYPLDVPRALAALDRIAPLIDDRWWSRGIEPVGWLGNGRADLATAWHHRVVSAQWDGLAVDLVWAGGILVVDQWSIPKGARESDLAIDLLRFGLLPERQAALSRETRLGPVTSEAVQWIEPWLRPTIPTAPPQYDALVPLDVAWWGDHETETRAAFARWLDSVPG